VGTKYYLAIADRHPGETNWSIVFPDFPGVTSVAERFADIMRQAKDALGSAVEDMERDGETLPLSIEEDAMPEYDPSAFVDPRTLLVPVEVSGRALRVNVSLDEGLLARIDDVSKRTGMSRSALLARGARMVIATEVGERVGA
jgi:predicted RNase H-like HicB family nuclease